MENFVHLIPVESLIIIISQNIKSNIFLFVSTNIRDIFLVLNEFKIDSVEQH